MNPREYQPSSLQFLLWDLAGMEAKLSSLRGASRVERLVALAELQEMLNDAQDNVRAALREIETDIRSGGSDERLARRPAEGEA